MQAGFEIQLIAVIVAVACSIPGVFLVLRKMALMSDSITHTILLGIVLAFFVTKDLSSPFLILGAAAMGLITVWLTELVQKTKLVSEDSAIGVIFPLLFSIAIILITRYAGSVHLDTDSVLLGELAFAPFNRMLVNGVDFGAKAIYTSGILLIINVLMIALLFKELKIATFDPMLASVLGFSPIILHYGLMALVSLTAVGAFESVGSVLVVAFMIGPPVTAYLLTDDLKTMLFLSGGIGAASAVFGYQAASLLDVSIAGSIASAIGLIFFLVFIFAPKQGLVTKIFYKRKKKNEFAKNVLLLHIYRNQNMKEEKNELKIQILQNQLNWKDKQMLSIIHALIKEQTLEQHGEIYSLTHSGMTACEVLEQNLQK